VHVHSVIRGAESRKTTSPVTAWRPRLDTLTESHVRFHSNGCEERRTLAARASCPVFREPA
jgi:hypothetical protein